MPDGVAPTTVRWMTEWIDLESADHVIGYGVHAMTIVNSEGAGPACYLQLIDANDGDVKSYLMNPDLAGRLAWEMMGVMCGYAEGAYALDTTRFDGTEDIEDDDDLESLARSLGLFDDDDEDDDE